MWAINTLLWLVGTSAALGVIFGLCGFERTAREFGAVDVFVGCLEIALVWIAWQQIR